MPIRSDDACPECGAEVDEKCKAAPGTPCYFQKDIDGKHKQKLPSLILLRDITRQREREVVLV